MIISRIILEIQKNGLIHFTKQVFKFIKNKFFLYQNHYILQKTLEELKEPEIRVNNPDLRIISNEEEFNNLVKERVNINAPFSIEDFERKISQGQILFCILIEKDLAHSSWVVMSSNVKIHPPLNINYKQENFIHYCITAPNYQRMGLYPYTLFKILEFLKRKGLSKAKLTVLKDNIPSIKGATKVGFEVCGEGKFLKLFLLKFWKEQSKKNSML